MLLLSKKIYPFVKNWVAIYNTSIWKYGNEFLHPYTKTQESFLDECETRPLSECETDENCAKYKNKKCVNKSRVQVFEPNVSFFDDDQNEYIFKDLISTTYNPRGVYQGTSSLRRDDYLNEEFTCHIFQRKNTNDVYLAFSTGRLIKDIYTAVAPKDFIEKTLEYIKTNYYENRNNEVQNIILCGHSQGCVMAQYIGLLIMKDRPDIFNQKYWIIGSGPFHWIHHEDEAIFTKNAKKIAIFVLRCELEQYYMYDPFIFHNKQTEIQISDYEYYNLFLPKKSMYSLNIELNDPDTPNVKKYVSDLSYLNAKDLNLYPYKDVSVIPFIEPTEEELYSGTTLINPTPFYRKRMHNWNSYRYIFNILFRKIDDYLLLVKKQVYNKSLYADSTALFGTQPILGGKRRKTHYKHGKTNHRRRKTCRN